MADDSRNRSTNGPAVWPSPLPRTWGAGFPSCRACLSQTAPGRTRWSALSCSVSMNPCWSLDLPASGAECGHSDIDYPPTAVVVQGCRHTTQPCLPSRFRTGATGSAPRSQNRRLSPKPAQGSPEPVCCRRVLTMLARAMPVRSACSFSSPPFRMIKPVMRSISASSRWAPSRSAMRLRTCPWRKDRSSASAAHAVMIESAPPRTSSLLETTITHPRRVNRTTARGRWWSGRRPRPTAPTAGSPARTPARSVPAASPRVPGRAAPPARS